MKHREMEPGSQVGSRAFAAWRVEGVKWVPRRLLKRRKRWLGIANKKSK